MAQPALKLYELAGAEDDRLFSPFCWRIRLALDHKGLPFTTIPWRFTEKDRLPDPSLKRVPVLTEGDDWISESWRIALHLERRYPDRPSLFGGAGGEAMAALCCNWVDQAVMSTLFPLIVKDIHDILHEKDRQYFRESREAGLGRTLEAACGDPEKGMATFRRSLAPARTTLKRQPFLGGEGPLYPDFALFSLFRWSAAVHAQDLLEAGDSLQVWLSRMEAGLSDASRALRVQRNRGEAESAPR